MNERLFHACASVLILALQLRTNRSESVSEVRRRIIAALDHMMASGRRMSLPARDLAEARYAMVAFIDEQVLKSNWAGRTEWMKQPLQLEFYKETTAGENFFVRLRAHLQGGSSGPIIEAYYLCLALGFTGAYGNSGDNRSLQKFLDAAQASVERAVPPSKPISPHGKGSGALQSVHLRWTPLAVVLGGSLLLGLGILGGLGGLTSSRVNRLQQQVGGLTSLHEASTGTP